VPVVLCDLEGKSYKEAAQQLGCPAGTFGARLSRARALLAQRLSRRGVALTVGALTVVLSQNAASASVPAAVVSNTIKAAGPAAGGVISAKAVALCEGVVKNMLWTKLRYPVGMVLALAALAFGAGLLHHAFANPVNTVANGAAAKAHAHPAQAGKKTDAERFLGAWRISSVTVDGHQLPEAFTVLARLTFTKDGKASMSMGMEAKDGSYKVVGDGQVDLLLDQGQDLGPAIYKFDGNDKLTLCGSTKDGATQRPTKFNADKDSGQILFVLQRAKPGEEKPTAEEMAKYKDQLDQIRGSASRELMANRLRQIGLAFHQFADVNQELPLHAIYSKDDKTPLLSWRVALLPYLGHKGLFDRFKLDEAWDSPHNKKLIAEMPDLYAPAGDEKPGKKEEGRTHLQVFTGPDSLFDGTKRMKFVDITDGTSITLLVVEGKEAVTWTRPVDLKLPKAGEKMPALGGQFKNGVLVLFCDGSVRMLPGVPAPEVLRALVTPAGNEEIDFENMKVVPKK
jgi:uncharacterized protein (TIGR03067 family)